MSYIKFGDVFYTFATALIKVPRRDIPTIQEDIWIGVIEKRYYVADVAYFNGRKSIELCSKSPEEIEKNNNGRWYGSKIECDLDDLDNKITKYGSFYSSLEMARAAAKDFFTKDELKTSKSGIKIYYMDNPEDKNSRFSLM